MEKYDSYMKYRRVNCDWNEEYLFVFVCLFQREKAHKEKNGLLLECKVKYPSLFVHSVILYIWEEGFIVNVYYIFRNIKVLKLFTDLFLKFI